MSAALGLVDTETLNKTIQSIADQDSQGIIRIIDEVVSRGYDLRNFCREMMVHIRALLVVKIAGFDSELVQLPDSEADSLKRLSESFSEQDLLRFFTILTKTEQDIKTSSQPRFQIEMGLVRLAHARRLFLLEDALAQIEALRSTLGGTSTSALGRAPMTQKGSRPTQDSTRLSPPVRASAPQPRPTENPSTAKPAHPEQRAIQPAEAPPQAAESSPRAAVAVSPSPTRSEVNATIASSTPEPPPAMADLYDAAPPPAAKPDPIHVVASSDRGPVDKIKGALESKRKMMAVSALDKATITIDGDYLRVVFAPADSNCKTQIEARDKRIAIEDACEQVLGRRLTLFASISGGPEIANINTPATSTSISPEPAAAALDRNNGPEGNRAIDVATASQRGTQRKAKVKEPAEDDPKLRALIDKFHGEVIEVIKPEQ